MSSLDLLYNSVSVINNTVLYYNASFIFHHGFDFFIFLLYGIIYPYISTSFILVSRAPIVVFIFLEHFYNCVCYCYLCIYACGLWFYFIFRLMRISLFRFFFSFPLKWFLIFLGFTHFRGSASILWDPLYIYWRLLNLKCDLSYNVLENSVLSMARQSETSLLRTVRGFFLRHLHIAWIETIRTSLSRTVRDLFLRHLHVLE